MTEKREKMVCMDDTVLEGEIIKSIEKREERREKRERWLELRIENFGTLAWCTWIERPRSNTNVGGRGQCRHDTFVVIYHG